MYCVNCGVKLQDGEKKCPLCGVRVFHPDFEIGQKELLYPKGKFPKPEKKTRFLQFAVLTFLALCIAIVLLCDWQFSPVKNWSGYVVGATVLLYIVAILPTWFKKPNPVIFLPCDFLAATLFLLYINLKTNSRWFLPFAFPVMTFLCLVVTAVITLLRYTKNAKLYIFGGANILLGGGFLAVEFLINFTFGFDRFIGWSLYPLAVLTVLGGFLIFLGICKVARETFERKFFV